MALLSAQAFEAYKRRMVPVLYDWFTHYHLNYPTQTCRWGPKVEELGYKTRYRAYLSEQVVDETRPNTLILAHIDVLKPHVASCEAVSNWHEKSTSSFVTIQKTVHHPGEVNKVRELPQHPEVVVTHTDSKKLFVWNMERQPDRRPQAAGLSSAKSRRDKASDRAAGSGPSDPSVPDLVLVGHEDEALFPLACSTAEPRVASGGNDHLVLLWDLRDSVTSLTASTAPAVGEGRRGPELQARTRLEGHENTVGDLCFQPGSAQCLVSVADDGLILTWDARQAATGPVGRVAEAHGKGVNVMCVDWCPHDQDLLVTGAEDGTLNVWDRRRMASAADVLHSFEGHRNSAERSIIHVEWHPTNKDVFASGSEDHTVAIWDLSRTELKPAPAAAKPAPAAGSGAAAAGGEGAEEEGRARKRTRSSAAGTPAGGKEGGKEGAKELPPQLIFQHLGHRLGRVTDFQWHPVEQWTIISVSDNSGVTDEGSDGSLQVWRIMDLIYRPYSEAVAELEQHRDFIMHGAAGAKAQEARDKAARADKAEDKPAAEAAAAGAGAGAGAVEVKREEVPAAAPAEAAAADKPAEVAEAEAAKDSEPTKMEVDG
ncbi:hypothetical protein HYH03_000612 [Edaphochlamys debaryana]|uniref:Histone-binding protein RBBP4-like N-terminal domain-containing protein n=1 Tax=Edaphochlamys debaryana TaxID=47281 RepID=A0A836C6P4_9CHLO|nr:hypothetical protein HYH03_000612 [Edaphochlamys debaryana]|eukprot:KAG2502120.1 hypothetical protein HYH03_000612 [Edaphochlamys debaryana]